MEEKTNDSLDSDNKVLLNLYNEICKSYHLIDDFRMKLLSLLPLFSIFGVLFMNEKIIGESELIGL